MLARDGIVRANEPDAWQPPNGKPHFAPKAKSVVWLFMNGGVSHAESFDPKPEMTKYAGKSISETPYADTQKPERLNRREVAFNVELRQKLYPLQVGFRKYGDSGIELSDWVPHIGSCIDDIAIVRSMWTTDDNHGAQTQFHSGRHMLDGEYPTLVLGCITGWVPSMRTCRSSSRWVTANTGMPKMVITLAPLTMPCRFGSIPTTHLTTANRPAAWVSMSKNSASNWRGD